MRILKAVDRVYESRTTPLLPHSLFLRRLALHSAAAIGLVILSLFIGMSGYVLLEDLSWIDGFLNAAMLLGGMGPIATLRTRPGKLFAGVYALYAGLVFLIAVGVVLAPIIHRLLHKFHLDDEEK